LRSGECIAGYGFMARGLGAEFAVGEGFAGELVSDGGELVAQGLGFGGAGSDFSGGGASLYFQHGGG